MDLQPRHIPHLIIIVVTMIGTVYFFHKQDQMKLQKSASFTSEIELQPKPATKSERKSCDNRKDGYRCYSKPRDSK